MCTYTYRYEYYFYVYSRLINSLIDVKVFIYMYVCVYLVYFVCGFLYQKICAINSKVSLQENSKKTIVVK